MAKVIKFIFSIRVDMSESRWSTWFF